MAPFASPSHEPWQLCRQTSPQSAPWSGKEWNQGNQRSLGSGWRRMRWKRPISGRRTESVRSSVTVRSFLNPSSGLDSYMGGLFLFLYIYISWIIYIYMYLYNCITTICHYFCHLYRNMFWSQVILSISWFHQELVLVHDLTCSSCQAMGLRWGCQRVLRCHRWLNAFEESGSNHGKGGNSTPWFLVF